MSGKIYRNEFGIMSFIQFINEAIIPKQIDYGTDFKNKEWFSVNPQVHYTYYSIDRKYYCIMIDHGDLGFGVSYKPPNINFDSLRKILRFFTFDRTRSFSAVSIFDYTFYILIEGIKKFDIKEIKFNGSDDNLAKFYSRLIKSPTFNVEMNKLGFKYTELDDEEYHHFIRN